MVRKGILGILFLLVSFFQVQAQSTYRLVEQGNRLLKNGEFSEAEVKYRKALDADGSLSAAQFNIGNAKYAQEDYDAAVEKYKKTAEDFTLKKNQAEAFHNLGNAYLSQEKYEESVEAYKSALRLEPNDMDTKYNLAYAQLMLKKEQEQEQQEQQEDQKEEDEENEDEANKEEQEEQQDGDEEEESDDGEKEESDEGEEEEQENGDEDKESEKEENAEDESAEDEKNEKPNDANEAQLSNEQAEQILKMLQSEEGKLQEKLEEDEKGEAIKVIIEKDW